MKNYKKNIKTELQGGLGNQLFIYASIKVLAKKWNRNIKFDISSFNQSEKYNRDLEIKKLGLHVESYSSILSNLQFLKKIIYKFSKFSFNMIIKETEYNQFENFKEPKLNNCKLVGYFQNALYFDDIQDDILGSIKSSNLYSQIKGEVSIKFDVDKSIAIHLRSYEEAVVNKDDILTPPHTYIDNALNALKYNKDSERLIVFTDNEDYAQRVLGKRVYTIYQEPEAVNALIALSQFKKIICSNSSFGWWGAYLSKSKLVTYPSYSGYKHYPTPHNYWKII